MKKSVKRLFAALLSPILLLGSAAALASCTPLKPDDERLNATFSLARNEKFGGIDVLTSIDDFLALGFQYGDSVSIYLDNGREVLDVPFYNGYYTRRGQIVLCAYPGYEALHFARNNGGDLYAELLGEEAKTLTIALNEHDKYKTQQEVMDTVYYNERERFDSDDAFANFRALAGGTLYSLGSASGTVYRGVSPVNDVYNRAHYADVLIKNRGVNFILDLADDEGDLESYRTNYGPMYNASYFKTLYEDGRVALLDLGSNYTGAEFKQKLGAGLREMLKYEGPYYVHCTEGKDRTGWVCLLFEALCGATYQEMLDDYMLTYLNYYGISKSETRAQYDAVVECKFIDMVYYLAGENDSLKLAETDYTAFAEKYLAECGLSGDEIIALRTALEAKYGQ